MGERQKQRQTRMNIYSGRKGDNSERHEEKAINEEEKIENIKRRSKERI